MSDTMFFGILGMPYELAISDEISRRQFYDTAQEARLRLAFQAPEPVIPAGWRLVPIEPTDDMLIPGQEECLRGPRGPFEDCLDAHAVYAAMLAAAPPLPVPPGSAAEGEREIGWAMIGPDGSRFEGPTPFKAAVAANQHRVQTDPVAAKQFTDMIESVQRENEAENARLLAEHGTLNCPACGGSGHIGDVEGKPLAILAWKVQQPHEWGYRDPVEGGFFADNTPFDLAAAALASISEPQAEPNADSADRDVQLVNDGPFNGIDAELLCEDEGCPHHGIDHICVVKPADLMPSRPVETFTQVGFKTHGFPPAEREPAEPSAGALPELAEPEDGLCHSREEIRAYALAAVQARVPQLPTREVFYALRDGRNAAHFEHRPVEDGATQRRAFDAGFAAGWDERANFAAPQARVPQESAELNEEQVGSLTYRGNTVSFIKDRATAYGDEIMRVWYILKDAGLHPGRTDDKLHEVVRSALAATSARQEPVGWSKMTREAARQYVDADFQNWLDQSVTENGEHSVYDILYSVYDAYSGWAAARSSQPPAIPTDRAAKLRDALHLIIGVTEGKDCPELDKPTEFAIAQSRGIRLSTIRRMAVAARTADDALAAAPATIPEGWKLVPVEPTLDMGWAYLNAAREASPNIDHAFNHPGYRAMLAAAPAAPEQPATSGAASPIASAPAAGGGWQPMETVPKDGTNVLLVNDKGNIAVGLWLSGALGTGWFLRGGNEPSYFFNSHRGPTHWIPLPEPPALASPGAEGRGDV